MRASKSAVLYVHTFTILARLQYFCLEKQTQKAAHALGITDGVVKGDLIVNEKGTVYVFELAARLGGPRFGTEMVPISNGTNILRAAIQQAIGEKIDISLLERKYNKGMVNRAIFPAPGKVTSITGLGELNKCDGFYDFKWFTDTPLSEGDIIPEYKDNSCTVAYFIASGETREEALKNADTIERKIKISTQPL